MHLPFNFSKHIREFWTFKVFLSKLIVPLIEFIEENLCSGFDLPFFLFGQIKIILILINILIIIIINININIIINIRFLIFEMGRNHWFLIFEMGLNHWFLIFEMGRNHWFNSFYF